MKYLPYDELCLHEKQKAQTFTGIPVKEKNIRSLSPEIKAKMIHSFLPSILKQLDVLNIDEIIGLVEKMEKYNTEIKNNNISEYCSLLSRSVQSFNILEINSTLKQLSAFINY